MNRSKLSPRAALLPVALAAALALAACDGRNDETVGQMAGDAVQSAAENATDALITTKIAAAIATDDTLEVTKIDIDTDNGRVVLSGTVPGPASRDRAGLLARGVDGVVDVDNRLLTVDAAMTPTPTTVDVLITTKINAALAVDDKLAATKIDVDTQLGRVVLTGTAPDAESRERATTLAQAVDGVTSVDNRLTVGS